MQLIKNNTPYIGKIRLKFEKFPWFSRGSDRLNKVHINLGFTKLVSRIKVDQTFDGDSIRPEIREAILKKTGLKIQDHKFGPLDRPDAYTLHNSCISPDGDYVGDISRGYWYLTNGLVAVRGNTANVAWQPESGKCIGYSHRASCGFGKGDMVFDASWVPTDEQMLEYSKYYVKHLEHYYAELMHRIHDFNMNIWAVEYIPFRLRGDKVIESYEDAYDAALNFAKYIS